VAAREISKFSILSLHDPTHSQKHTHNGQKTPKTENFQITQKPCFNIFLSVFGSVGIILDRFYRYRGIEIFSLQNSLVPILGPFLETNWLLSRSLLDLREFETQTL